MGPERARHIQRRREAGGGAGGEDAAADAPEPAVVFAAGSAARGKRGAASAALAATSVADGGTDAVAAAAGTSRAQRGGSAFARGGEAVGPLAVDTDGGPSGTGDPDVNAQRAIHRVQLKLRGLGFSADGTPTPVEVQVGWSARVDEECCAEAVR
jgi:hypothetical protein